MGEGGLERGERQLRAPWRRCHGRRVQCPHVGDLQTWVWQQRLDRFHTGGVRKPPWAAIGAEVAIGALLVASCTSGSTGPEPVTKVPTSSTSTGLVRPRPPASPAAGSELSCGNYIDSHASIAPLKVVLGVVALPVSPAYPALGTSRTGATAGPTRLFAKTGLVVKPGVNFEVVVPPAFDHRVEIGWGGQPSTPTSRVVVSNCANPDSTGWLAYPGGYWVDHPACVPLIVKVGIRQQEVHVGVGAACPGQRPPTGPNQR